LAPMVAIFMAGIAVGVFWSSHQSRQNATPPAPANVEASAEVKPTSPGAPAAVPTMSAAPSARPRVKVQDSPADPEAVADVKRLIPNIESVTLEDGRKLLRESGLAEYSQNAKDYSAKIKVAEQAFLQATNTAAKQTALDQYQSLQAAQTDTLTQIAGKTQARIKALEKLKQPE